MAYTNEATLIQQLLSKGQLNIDKDISLERINKILGVIGYEAIGYPHSSLIVLRDYSTNLKILNPWKEQTVDEAKEIFKKIASNSFVNKDSPTVKLLLNNGWLREESEVKLGFTERTLVQFSDFLSTQTSNFNRCKLCSFLTDEGEYHSQCKEMLNRKNPNIEN